MESTLRSPCLPGCTKLVSPSVSAASNEPPASGTFPTMRAWPPLTAVTLYPAQILGVADRIGSLEAGKDATLIVTTGDPLEIPTQVTRAFIEGREVQLSDRQKRLWEKYKEKYRRMGIDNP